MTNTKTNTPVPLHKEACELILTLNIGESLLISAEELLNWEPKSDPGSYLNVMSKNTVSCRKNPDGSLVVIKKEKKH